MSYEHHIIVNLKDYFINCWKFLNKKFSSSINNTEWKFASLTWAFYLRMLQLFHQDKFMGFYSDMHSDIDTWPKLHYPLVVNLAQQLNFK